MKPLVGLSLMLAPDFVSATLPLFEAGEVEVLEWSFDTVWGTGAPDWAAELLDHFAGQDRLLGHGVTYSPMTARFSERQRRWLERLTQECQERSYRHVSEHFGFVSAGSFHDGAPLPVPRTPEALRLGRDRLERMADACGGLRVGLENLAFAFSARDVLDQGAFLADLLEPVDGFLLLDLHNLYCQAANFAIPAHTLLDDYPLDRVTELHVSGGSWSEWDGGRIRRDTHDGAVPRDVFELLPDVLTRCPHVEYVILERLGGSLGDRATRTRCALSSAA